MWLVLSGTRLGWWIVELYCPFADTLGGTVTLIASVTSDPSATSSITLPVIAPPITVAFVNPPATVPVNGSVNFAVNALNDSSGAGVTLALTCGSTAAGACGSFTDLAVNDTTGTYLAPGAVPPGGTVTITATSVTLPSQSASITLTVTPLSAAGAISVSINPSSFYVATLGGGHTVRLAATVSGDISGAGVTWTVACGSTAPGWSRHRTRPVQATGLWRSGHAAGIDLLCGRTRRHDG